MGFHIKSFLFALAGVFFACAAHAQCCECEEYDGCPGQENLGTLENPQCYPCGNVDCSFCDWCADFTDDCPAWVPAGRLCKQIQTNCGGVAGCTKYELCNPNNGLAGVYFVGPENTCHIEGNGAAAECQPNTVSCNQFGIETNFALLGVQQSEQTGPASWNGNAWDTGACKLNATNKSVMSVVGLDIYCDDFNIVAEVTEENRYRTQSLLGQPVYYTLIRNYCKKCHAGYLPVVKQSPDMGVYLAPENVSSQYGVAFCSNVVHAPNYAPGCMIPYPLNSSSVPDVCRVPCPGGMETIENGATSIEDCVPDVNQIYHDDTGTFTLGTERCRP